MRHWKYYAAILCTILGFSGINVAIPAAMNGADPLFVVGTLLPMMFAVTLWLDWKEIQRKAKAKQTDIIITYEKELEQLQTSEKK